jgi:hypothetical protein
MVSLPKKKSAKKPAAKKPAAKKKAIKKKAAPKKKATQMESLNLSLTDDLVREACKIVEAGNFRKVAAQRLGVPMSTWNSWLQRGKKELREFSSGKRTSVTVKASFVRELDKAEGRCHARLLQDVISSDSIQAKQWFLERRYNKLYSKNPNAHIDDETGEESKVDALEILADKLRTLMDP